MIGITALLIANFIGGALSPMFVKFGVLEIPPLTFTLLRFILAILFTLPIYIRQKSYTITRHNIKFLLFGSTFFTLNLSLFSIGLQYTTVIMSQILYTLVPVIVGIMAHFILGERLTRNKIIGSGFAFSGVIFLITQSVLTNQTLTFGTLLGNSLMLIGVFSWSVYFIVSKKLTNVHSPITTSFFSFLVTVILLSLFVPFELSIRPLSTASITTTGLGSLFGVALFSSVIMFSLIQLGIKRTSAFTASLFSYTGPFFAGIVSIPLFGEKITPLLIIGGLLIIFGVFYATSLEHIKK